MRASAAPQKAAHEALVKAHAADEKRRVAETAALAASDPSKLVGSEVSVRRKVQRGSSTSTPLRLCSRAPRTVSFSATFVPSHAVSFEQTYQHHSNYSWALWIPSSSTKFPCPAWTTIAT